MNIDLWRAIQWVWAAVAIYWVAAALRTKRAVRHEGAATRLFHVAVMCLGFGLLFSPRLSVGPLAWRILPPAPAFQWAGLGLSACGCAFAIWARGMLGGNWSGWVAVKQDHTLIRRGPYTIVRHPIYSGFLTGLAGVVMALGELRGLIGWLLILVGWSIKARMEEAFMTEQFGAEYARYQSEVKALVPYVI